jgi:hypothetical protein
MATLRRDFDGVGHYDCEKCAANGNGFTTNSYDVMKGHEATCDGSGRV